ncbi:hypothetical protein RJ639_025318 [Escallonia herrerae]|uniref:Uncharacterized protein n=1 Tax=Escallonia herrerae TaxID=1293975 RepID=A0AA89ACJ2_9ASTE|nr:hypothetical protein RJ639_025318 [Escallonia herrerae]
MMNWIIESDAEKIHRRNKNYKEQFQFIVVAVKVMMHKLEMCMELVNLVIEFVFVFFEAVNTVLQQRSDQSFFVNPGYTIPVPYTDRLDLHLLYCSENVIEFTPEATEIPADDYKKKKNQQKQNKSFTTKSRPVVSSQIIRYKSQQAGPKYIKSSTMLSDLALSSIQAACDLTHLANFMFVYTGPCDYVMVWCKRHA